MKYRDRKKPPARPDSTLDPKPLVLIYCEGTETEPNYLERFKDSLKNQLVHVIPIGTGRSSLAIVQYAKTRRDESFEEANRKEDQNLVIDSVWVVFDVDGNEDITQARVEAAHADISCAISNPSFELWLYVHFEPPPGAIDRHELFKRVKGLISGYSKTITPRIFNEQLLPHYTKAVQSARQMDNLNASIDEPGRNPSTGIWELTEYIRSQSGDT